MGAGAACTAVIAWCAVLCLYDIRERRLPNWLTVPGAIVVLVAAAAAERGFAALCGAAALAGLYLVLHLIAPAGMGAGDVKLAVGLGALTGAFGYDVWVLAAVGAPMLTAVVGCLTFKRRAETAVPHGPSMCVASGIAVLLAIL